MIIRQPLWIGNMDKKGRNALALTILNMLPKLELAAIFLTTPDWT
jgi:hypothetical protein